MSRRKHRAPAMSNPLLIIASNPSDATECAEREGVDRWITVTPNNYATVVPSLAVARQRVLWSESTWMFPPAMLAAIGACNRRGSPS